MKDFFGILSVFVFLSAILDDTPYALLAFVGAFITAAILSPIRIKHRDRFVRDSVIYFLLRGIKGRI